MSLTRWRPRKRWLALLLAALALWLTDRRPADRPAHQAELLLAGDLRVRALRAGVGDTTLLLLHGFGESLLSWRSLVDPLAQRAKVVAIDLPGFGLSDKPSGPYDLATTVWRLSDLLDRWTAGPVVVIGHSTGGEIAAALALARPDRVVGTVLIAPAGAGLTAALDTVTRDHAGLVGWWNVATGYAMPLHDRGWLAEPPGLADYDPLRDPAYRAAATHFLEQFDFAALGERFGALAQPTLLIWGEQDPTIPLAIGQHIAALLPCRRFVTLPQTLHRPHMTAPDTVTAELLRFLRQPPRCPTASQPHSGDR